MFWTWVLKKKATKKATKVPKCIGAGLQDIFFNQFHYLPGTTFDHFD